MVATGISQTVWFPKSPFFLMFIRFSLAIKTHLVVYAKIKLCFFLQILVLPTVLTTYCYTKQRIQYIIHNTGTWNIFVLTKDTKVFFQF